MSTKMSVGMKPLVKPCMRVQSSPVRLGRKGQLNRGRSSRAVGKVAAEGQQVRESWSSRLNPRMAKIQSQKEH